MRGSAVLWIGCVPCKLHAVETPAASASECEWISAQRQASGGAEPRLMLARAPDAVDGAAPELWCVFFQRPYASRPSVLSGRPQRSSARRARPRPGVAWYSTWQLCASDLGLEGHCIGDVAPLIALAWPGIHAGNDVFLCFIVCMCALMASPCSISCMCDMV